MSFDYAVQVADSYWAKRDIRVPCHPQPRVVSIHEKDRMNAVYGFMVDMVTLVDSCTIVITPYGCGVMAMIVISPL